MQILTPAARIAGRLALFLCASLTVLAQATQVQPPSGTAPQPVSAAGDPLPTQPVDKRVFGVLPNYRTVNDTGVYAPITARQKYVIASKDSFDYPLVMLGGAYALLGQIDNQDESYGQGIRGYGKRLAANYADQALGNMMTEAIFPSLLHEDPRYFRRGAGTGKSRTLYALSRIFVTRTDSGGRRFNFSEILGNASAVAISNAYHPDERTLQDNTVKFATQLGTDAVSQVLKEFWPDIKRKWFTRHRDE